MIFLYHNTAKVTVINATFESDFSNELNKDIVKSWVSIAHKYPDEILVWCHQDAKNYLNSNAILDCFHHNKVFISYSPSSSNYLDKRIGYVEDSTYININKKVNFATWQMSSYCGAIHTSIIKACSNEINQNDSFDYFLISFAKRAMNHGLLCYSCPSILYENRNYKESISSSIFELFVFTKQHFKTRWIVLLFFNMLLYEKKIPILPLCYALGFSKRKFNPVLLQKIPLQSSKLTSKDSTGTIDVLIPTIGRKEYLLEVLNCLAKQSYLPTNVILIEQNPLEGSSSNLEYIQAVSWPFTIVHQFIHQAGACNARNIGLNLVKSDYVFMADDDILFDEKLLENALHVFKSTGSEAFLVSCVMENQSVSVQPPIQVSFFGSGHAFVKSSCIQNIRFKMGYEFGFGEDIDFGMQLRNTGVDVLYISSFTILHLKAPIGGFRTKPVLLWQNESILPKPSPTVMLYRLTYNTKEQLLNYKTTLFFKNLTKEIFFNPIQYVKVFNQKWHKSIYWANRIKT